MAESLAEVARQRDEYWERLLEMGREMLDADPDNPNSELARLRRRETEQAAEIALLEEQMTRYVEETVKLQKTVRDQNKDKFDLDRKIDQLERQLLALREKGKPKKPKAREPEVEMPKWWTAFEDKNRHRTWHQTKGRPTDKP